MGGDPRVTALEQRIDDLERRLAIVEGPKVPGSRERLLEIAANWRAIKERCLRTARSRNDPDDHWRYAKAAVFESCATHLEAEADKTLNAPTDISEAKVADDEYFAEEYTDPKKAGCAAFIRSGGPQCATGLRIICEVNEIEDAHLIAKLLNENRSK